MQGWKKQLYDSFKNPTKSSVVLFYNYNDEGKLIEIKSKNMEYNINLGRP